MGVSRCVGHVVALAALADGSSGSGSGQDSFTYKVNDGKVDSAIATVTLIVS